MHERTQVSLVRGLQGVEVAVSGVGVDHRRRPVAASVEIGDERSRHSPVAVLKRMNLHEAVVQPCGFDFSRRSLVHVGFVHRQQPVHFGAHLLGWTVLVQVARQGDRVVGADLVLPLEQRNFDASAGRGRARGGVLGAGDAGVPLADQPVRERPSAGHGVEDHVEASPLVLQVRTEFLGRQRGLFPPHHDGFEAAYDELLRQAPGQVVQALDAARLDGPGSGVLFKEAVESAPGGAGARGGRTRRLPLLVELAHGVARQSVRLLLVVQDGLPGGHGFAEQRVGAALGGACVGRRGSQRGSV